MNYPWARRAWTRFQLLRHISEKPANLSGTLSGFWTHGKCPSLCFQLVNTLITTNLNGDPSYRTKGFGGATEALSVGVSEAFCCEFCWLLPAVFSDCTDSALRSLIDICFNFRFLFRAAEHLQRLSCNGTLAYNLRLFYTLSQKKKTVWSHVDHTGWASSWCRGQTGKGDTPPSVSQTAFIAFTIN